MTPEPLYKKKIEKTGHGGYGGIHIDKTKNQIEGQFHDTVDTNDAQEAELKGIAAAVSIAEQSPQEKITILCDCKNAVKYSNKQYIAPRKYAKPTQQIYTKLQRLRHTGKTIHIDWIPGHTGNIWNKLVDQIAKAATQDWVTPNSSAGLIARILPHERALDGYHIRKYTPVWGTGQYQNKIICKRD